jgi:molybdopterin-synthase adenylyltransferase
MIMTRDELRRYARQIILPEVGVAGQERLKAARVLLIGLGGLGSPVAQYLVAAGIGTLALSEFDTLELHNLQRQTLYTTAGVGQPKLELALEHLRAVNPHVVLEAKRRLEPDGAAALLEPYDLVIDATDNVATRYLISDTCVALRKSWVWGAAVGWDGMVSLFDQHLSLRRAFKNPPEQADNCDTLGVHGPLLGVVGSIMAGQAIKHLLGLETLYGRLWHFDALNGATRTIRLRTDQAP